MKLVSAVSIYDSVWSPSGKIIVVFQIIFLHKVTQYSAVSSVDVHGPKYFLICLDDFNNNKPNKDLISLVDNQTSSFKLPEYINTQTMDSKYGAGNYYPGKPHTPEWACIDVADIGNNERGCST